MLSIYSFFITVMSIILSPLILIAFAAKPKFRAGFSQKLGCYKKVNDSRQCIWFHAVSVGEVNAIECLVKKLKKNCPQERIIITTVTATGNQVAKSKFKEITDEIYYFPYDFTFSVKSAIKALKPKAIIIAETEIWPNFSRIAKEKNIPLMIVNGRISPNSHKGYKKFRFFFEKILKNYTLILMQSESDMKRIVDIGADPEITEVMGNLKYDIDFLVDESITEEYKKIFGIKNERILIAGSTHQGEDKIILNIFSKLKIEFPDIKLIIAPRHPERNDDVLKLISATGMAFGLRSSHCSFQVNDIIMLDTMGELSKAYAACHIAFIGGSFSGTGGHNPLEPAIYRVPVVSGPTVYNFKDIYKYLTATGAAKIASTENELYKNIWELLADEQNYSQAQSACSTVFESNKGALDYVINKLLNMKICT